MQLYCQVKIPVSSEFGDLYSSNRRHRIQKIVSFGGPYMKVLTSCVTACPPPWLMLMDLSPCWLFLELNYRWFRSILTATLASIGASGGGLFNREGKLIGLVTSNTKHTDTGICFTKLNYSIGVALLAPVLDACLDKGVLNITKISAFASHIEGLGDMWLLKAKTDLPGGSATGVPKGQKFANMLGHLPGHEDYTRKLASSSRRQSLL